MIAYIPKQNNFFKKICPTLTHSWLFTALRIKSKL